jgi:hypothetical protein
MSDQVYVANTTFSTDLDGAAVVVHKDHDRVRGDHPLYQQCPELFDPVDDHVRFDTETAVAVPGEDRGVQPGVRTASAPVVAKVSDPTPPKPAAPPKSTPKQKPGK